MSDDASNTGLTTRVRRAVEDTRGRVSRAGSGLLDKVRDTLDERVAPKIEDTARKMLLKLSEPENARQLQQTLAGVAQLGIKAGFRSDPDARLLFEFVDWIEQEHSREKVLEMLVKHAVVYEQQLLEMLLEAAQPGARSVSDQADFASVRDRASARLLDLLCELAHLEHPDPPPQRRDAQIDYFENADLPERFAPLARMAAGDEETFRRRAAERRDASPPKPKKRGLLRRAISRVAGSEAAEKPDEKRSALARFVPSLSDPATRFLTLSYLFFMQSYMVRAMIEELPNMLETAGEFERQAEAESGDILDME